MAVVPCSVRTMSAIACGLASNLLTRAADVALKEKRRLVLAVRETPLHLGHLRTMAALAEMGAVIAPPMPAFYTLPESLDEIVDQQVGRILDLLGAGPSESATLDGDLMVRLPSAMPRRAIPVRMEAGFRFSAPAAIARSLLAQAIAALALSASASGQDWPQFRGPQRDGVYPDRATVEPFPPEGPELVWERSVGAGFSGSLRRRGNACPLSSAGKRRGCRGVAGRGRQAPLEVCLRDALQGRLRFR